MQVQAQCEDCASDRHGRFNEMTRSDREVQIELTTAVLIAADAGGVHQFLICVDMKLSYPCTAANVQR